MKKRLMAMLLSAAMILTLLPTMAFAETVGTAATWSVTKTGTRSVYGWTYTYSYKITATGGEGFVYPDTIPTGELYTGMTLQLSDAEGSYSFYNWGDGSLTYATSNVKNDNWCVAKRTGESGSYTYTPVASDATLDAGATYCCVYYDWWQWKEISGTSFAIPAETLIPVTLSKPTVQDWIYGKSANTPSDVTFNGVADPAGLEVEYQYRLDEQGAQWQSWGTGPSDAGEYLLRAHFDGNDDYAEGNSESSEFTIAKATLTDSMVTANNTTYNKAAYAGPTVSDENPSKITSSDYTAEYFKFKAGSDETVIDAADCDGAKLEATPQNAGTYVVKVSGKGNYTGDVYKTFTINPAKASVTGVSTASHLTYNGGEQDLLSNPGTPTGGTLKYAVTGGSAPQPELTDFTTDGYKKTDAGSYKVWYYVDAEEGGNYVDSDVSSTESVSITPKTVELSWDKDTFVYNGQNQKPTATVTNLVGDDACTVSTVVKIGNVEQASYKDAGSYTAAVTELSNNNYMMLLESPTACNKDFSITKAPLTITANDLTAYVGDEAPSLEGQYTVTGIVDGETKEEALTELPQLNYFDTPDMTKPGKTNIVFMDQGTASSNYEIENRVGGTLTVNSRPSSGSSGGGGSVSTPTVTVPVSGKNDSVKVQASVSGSTATVKELKSADAEKVAGGAIEIDLSGLNKTITAAKIPEKTVDEIADKGNLAVKLSTATVTFDAKATESISGQTAAGGLELKVETNTGSTAKLTAKQQEAIKGEEIDSQVVVNVSMLSGGKAVGSFNGGSATLKVPYTLKKDQSASGLCVFFIGSNGEVEKLPCFYVNGEVVFTVEHFSDYVIAYDAVAATVCPKDLTCLLSQFPDLRTTSWYHDGIHYCLEKGLMNGMPDGLFLPGGDTTRAQATSMLWRVMGSPAVNYELNFSDVRHGCWYEEAVRWATSEGIINGVNDTDFAPTDPVTREQFASMLYRLAQIKGEKFDGEWTLDFSDLARMRAWAHDAASWCNQKGIMAGLPDGTFQPRGNTTRAQAASMIQRFNEIILGK